MTKFQFRTGVIGLLLFFYFNTSAQVYYDDAQVWYHVYLEKKLGKNFDVHFKHQGRFVNNVSQYGQGYAKIGVGYKFSDNIRVLANYVNIQRKRNAPYYKTRHRYQVALILKKELGYWTISYRNMFQCTYKSPFTSDDGYIPYYYDRNKLTVKYKANKRFEFYVSEEVNIALNNPQVKGLSRSRSRAGVFIKTRKNQGIDLYSIYQVQLQNGDWYDQDISTRNNLLKRKFVYGIGYEIEF